jgi:hypothetical protein
MRQQILQAAKLWRQVTDVRRFEEGMRAPRLAQERKLLEIVRANQETVYGREHGFERIDSIAEYRSRVPIHGYDALQPYIDRVLRGEPNILTREDPLMFAVTSGTTGSTKYIPVTPSFLEEYNHAVQVHTWRVVEDYPDIGRGTILTPCSSDVDGYTEGGKPYGAVSGFLTRRQPEVVKRFYALPFDVALIKDQEAKQYLTLLLAVQQDIRWAVAVSPSSLVLLAEKMQRHAERLIRDVYAGTFDDALWPADAAERDAAQRIVRERVRPNPVRARELEELIGRQAALLPRDVWPNLRLLCCWKGGTMQLYLQRLRRYWGETPTRDLGYMASEGRGSVPLVDAGAAGALAVTSHFFEFVPTEEIDDERPTCLTADQLQSNHEYYVLFTTSSGLYRYHINDIVRVVDFYRAVPLIQFVRKGQGFSSLTGEKLTESQMTASLLQVVEATGIEPEHFSAAPRWGEPPYYALLVELPATTLSGKRQFLQALDQALADANVEYRAKRESERLGPPVLRVVEPGTFERYRQRRVSQGAAAEQVKIPHLSPKLEFGQDFVAVEEVQSLPVA